MNTSDATRAALPRPEDRPVLRVDELAALLGIGRSAAYVAVRRGELPSIRVGRRVLIPTAQLRSLLGLDSSEPQPAA